MLFERWTVTTSSGVSVNINQVMFNFVVIHCCKNNIACPSHGPLYRVQLHADVSAYDEATIRLGCM